MIRLETDRLVFRDHELEDLEPYVAMESDPEYRAPQRVHPREELVRGFHEGPLRPKDLGLFAAVFKPDGRYVGRCGLYPFRNPEGQIVPGEAFLAYYIARPYWGRGIATEASRAWVAYGFETLGLSRIEAGINADNAASQRVVEKLGFKRIRSGGTGGIRWHDYELKSGDPKPHRVLKERTIDPRSLRWVSTSEMLPRRPGNAQSDSETSRVLRYLADCYDFRMVDIYMTPESNGWCRHCGRDTGYFEDPAVTDGTWWFAFGVEHYIRIHGYSLPEDVLADLRKRDFVVPDLPHT